METTFQNNTIKRPDLIPTVKQLTRNAVYEIVKDQLDNCSIARERWASFEHWAKSQGLAEDARIFVEPNYILSDFLLDHSWAVRWLIDHGFAALPPTHNFVPFDLSVETVEEARLLWHLLNVGGSNLIEEKVREVYLEGGGLPVPPSVYGSTEILNFPAAYDLFHRLDDIVASQRGRDE